MSDPKARKTPHLNFETVGSIVAMIVGLSALFVAWDQAQIMRKEQHANVLPIISVQAGFSSNGETYRMLVGVENNGVGPALIKSSELKVGETSINSWSTLTEDLLPEALSTGYSTSFSTAVGAISEGGSKELMRVDWPINEATTEAFLTLQSEILGGGSISNLAVCYCSVFDRCWIVDRNSQDDPRRVETCTNSGSDFSADLMATLNAKE